MTEQRPERQQMSGSFPPNLRLHQSNLLWNGGRQPEVIGTQDLQSLYFRLVRHLEAFRGRGSGLVSWSNTPRNANGTGIHNIKCALRQRSSDAETHDVIAVVGRIAFSGGRSQQPRRKHPRAAAVNSEAIALAVLGLGVARRDLVRAPVGGNAGVAVVVTVLGPLPNVPCHIVKAECVRRLGADRMCLAMVAKKTVNVFAAGVAIEPGVDRSGNVVITPVELSCGSGACCIFPLRFAGHPIRPVG